MSCVCENIRERAAKRAAATHSDVLRSFQRTGNYLNGYMALTSAASPLRYTSEPLAIEGMRCFAVGRLPRVPTTFNDLPGERARYERSLERALHLDVVRDPFKCYLIGSKTS